MQKRGCLLVGLGTPASADPADIREFLDAFLSDPSVVDFPRWLWKPILKHIVLRVRPKKIAPTYREIWTDEGSPLEVYTKAQCRAVAEALPEIEVKYAMTYTQPSIADTISEFSAREVAVIPLCPHYTPSTVADIYRQVAKVGADPNSPKLSIVEAWPAQTEYIAWYRRQLESLLAHYRPDRIVFSYHGVPQRKAHEPAAYSQQCIATTEAIMEGFQNCSYETVYQSKFGPGKWLQPATVERMRELPDEGVKKIVVLTPGFVADCIETIEEIDGENREAFYTAGGTDFKRIAPLNDDRDAGRVLAALFTEHFEQKGE